MGRGWCAVVNFSCGKECPWYLHPISSFHFFFPPLSRCQTCWFLLFEYSIIYISAHANSVQLCDPHACFWKSESGSYLKAASLRDSKWLSRESWRPRHGTLCSLVSPCVPFVVPFVVPKGKCSLRKFVTGNLHPNSQEIETSQGTLLNYLRKTQWMSLVLMQSQLAACSNNVYFGRYIFILEINVNKRKLLFCKSWWRCSQTLHFMGTSITKFNRIGKGIGHLKEFVEYLSEVT